MGHYPVTGENENIIKTVKTILITSRITQQEIFWYNEALVQKKCFSYQFIIVMKTTHSVHLITSTRFLP